MAPGNQKSARGTTRCHSRPPRNRGIKALRRALAPEKRSSLRKATADVTLCTGNRGFSNPQEESFQLHPCPCTVGKPFAMVIRLQPEILEELKQAMCEGQEAMMKFGDHATGHEIKVGTETFTFSSASEAGDLCDIYEQTTGENVLMEAACVWRKLCVQRILSATEKDRVKKRTAEAEKQQRLRKSILVDPTSQIVPSTGISESNKKLTAKVTKEPLTRKLKVIGSTSSSKNNKTLAERCQLPNRMEKLPTLEMMSVLERLSPREKVDGPEKFPLVDKESLKDRAKNQISAGRNYEKNQSAANMIKLRDFLISFLQANPKGVTMKEAEKAMVDGLLDSTDRKTIAEVLKSIAIYHAPGRYFLKPEKCKDRVGASSVRNQQGTTNITLDYVPSVAISFKASKKEFLSLQEKLAPSTSTHDLQHFSSEETAVDQRKLSEGQNRKNWGNLSAHNFGLKSNAFNDSFSESSSCSQSDSRGSNTSSSETCNGIDHSSLRSAENTDEEIDILSDNDTTTKFTADCQREVDESIQVQGSKVVEGDTNSDFPRIRMTTGTSLVQDSGIGFVSDSARNLTTAVLGKHGSAFLARHDKRKTSLHGPIQNIEEYNNYYSEFKKKYSTYHQLHVNIETFKRKFQSFKKDAEDAKRKEDNPLHVHGEARKNYIMERKRCKHMYNVFQGLHEELTMIKHLCKEYAEITGKD